MFIQSEIDNAISENDSWIKLANFGEYPHPKGLQKLSSLSAEQMIRFFHSLKGKIVRKFKGLPIFIGLPDYSFNCNHYEHQDFNVYGRVLNLKCFENALWIYTHWTSEGLKLIQEKKYQYISPHWVVRPINLKTYVPVRLLSVGLTNNPNIPMNPAKNYHPSPPLRTQSITGNLVFNNARLNASSNAFVRLVHDNMHASNDDYLSSWIKIKNLHPELYNNL